MAPRGNVTDNACRKIQGPCFCGSTAHGGNLFKPPGNSFPQSSFPLTSGRKTRALGATISGMRHRCRLRIETGWAELLFQNGCSQSSRFPTVGQGERRLWERDCPENYLYREIGCNLSAQ